jgi:hypothetical protein
MIEIINEKKVSMYMLHSMSVYSSSQRGAIVNVLLLKTSRAGLQELAGSHDDTFPSDSCHLGAKLE